MGGKQKTVAVFWLVFNKLTTNLPCALVRAFYQRRRPSVVDAHALQTAWQAAAQYDL